MEADSGTLMADSGPGPGPGSGSYDEVPVAPHVDHELDVNGNVDTESDGKGIEEKDVGGMNGEQERENEMVDEGKEEEDTSGEDVESVNKEMNGEGKENEMVDEGAEEDNSREDVKSVNEAYSVGDFVWGKIKSHPWWPGRIYEASSASDLAMKFRHPGRLLVAYFGDGSFSWCSASQLVPFVENFDRMSKQSTSRSFLNAVESALDEVSLLVEINMTCQCISKEGRAGLSWPLAMNAGIKEGTPVPNGKSIELFCSRYGPAEILKALKYHAKNRSSSNRFEFAVLRSWLSAFYRAKCGLPLPVYCVPVLVEGLEDKKDDQGIDANDFSIPIEVPIQGPTEEEFLSPPMPVSTGDKIYHRRKKKSVAELMSSGESKGSKKSTEDSSPSLVTSEKKRKRSVEKAKGRASSSKSVNEKAGKKVSKKPVNAEMAKTKQLSVSIPERDEPGDHRDASGSPLSPLSRDRKKSKYLSPPYTSPNWNIGRSSFKGESQMESQKVSSLSVMGERMTKAAQLILSSPDANNGKKAVKISRNGKRSPTTSGETDMNPSVNEVLSEVQSTALSPRSLKDDGSLEKTKGFISAFRDSVYLDGSNYEQYHKVKTEKKRKSSESGNGVAQDDIKSKNPVPSKKRKTNHIETEVAKVKKTSRPPSQGTEDAEAGSEASSVVLLVTFSTDFCLPSEDEIFQIYSKFGDLNQKETKVLHDSSSVQIVYRLSSDAEEAFKESVKQSPFGAAKVNFKLTYPSSDALKTSGFGKRSSPLEENSDIPLSALIADKEKSQMQLLKQKLKVISSILDKCNGKITVEEKADLEGQMKGLLEKVSAVTTTNT